MPKLMFFELYVDIYTEHLYKVTAFLQSSRGRPKELPVQSKTIIGITSKYALLVHHHYSKAWRNFLQHSYPQFQPALGQAYFYKHHRAC